MIKLAVSQSQSPIVNIGRNLTIEQPGRARAAANEYQGGRLGGIGNIRARRRFSLDRRTHLWHRLEISGIPVWRFTLRQHSWGRRSAPPQYHEFRNGSWNQAGLAMNGGPELECRHVRDPGQPLRFQRNHCEFRSVTQVRPGRDPSAHGRPIHLVGHAAAASRHGE